MSASTLQQREAELQQREADLQQRITDLQQEEHAQKVVGVKGQITKTSEILPRLTVARARARTQNLRTPSR